MRSKVDAELARLRIDADYLDQAIALKAGEGAQPREAPEPRSQRIESVSPPKRRRGRPASKREPILEIMRAEPGLGRGWHPKEISEGLAKRGIEMTVDAARVTLGRMAKEGTLQRRTEDNLFQLPLTPENAAALSNGSPPDESGSSANPQLPSEEIRSG
jgi:hypothetical protein